MKIKNLNRIMFSTLETLLQKSCEIQTDIGEGSQTSVLCLKTFCLTNVFSSVPN